MTATPLPALPVPLAAAGIALRLRREDDDHVLRALYRACRQDEPAVAGLPAEMRLPFLDQQYGLQRLHYDRHYPDAAWGIVDVDGAPAGRLYLRLNERDLRLIDIALLPHLRNRGIGGELVAASRALARDLGAEKVSLHVEQDNPALRLYRRQGFALVEPRPPYLLLEWPVG